MAHRKASSAAVGLLAASGLLASAGIASAAPLKGVVVHSNQRAHSIAVVDRGGRLHAVHVSRKVAMGRTVTLTVRKLRNGTLVASRVRTGRRAHKLRLRGRVTYSDRSRGVFVVSARGVSLVVHRRHNVMRAVMSAADSLPAPGTEVTISGTVDPHGSLTADTVENDGQNNNSVDLEGVILSIDSAARTVTISADDDDELTGASILVHIPDSLDLTAYHQGETLQIVASPNADGSYTAVGTSDDSNADQADAQEGQQGDDQQGESQDASSADVGGGLQPDDTAATASKK